MGAEEVLVIRTIAHADTGTDKVPGLGRGMVTERVQRGSGHGRGGGYGNSRGHGHGGVVVQRTSRFRRK